MLVECSSEHKPSHEMVIDKEPHSPMVFENNHGTEVDIWGTGKLIVDTVIFSTLYCDVGWWECIRCQFKVE